ncbi:hypothetical protein GOP47_0021981 [Adiantum capillus-veneris]|uniref:Legumain prodomain domain-containing protein n=1 Tax=Adiantum capillus-veneris TaxID=13818 RepID=A0A9D4UA75_ADICA|nr:hypothetical protein GOP47_0021981 [Adiantum capillus-veneris]
MLMAMLQQCCCCSSRLSSEEPWSLSPFPPTILMPTDDTSQDYRTRWAILIAGSSGYGNYRHQADVCHAYHVLQKGGLKEENIVVFMYDDIADSPLNPHPGTIINSPQGKDVYAGVPKDYTGSNVTVSNFLAAFLGNKSGVVGGSAKVIDSGPEDHIFMFYSDHGGPGILGMPTNPNLFAIDLVAAFKKKYEAGGYKKTVVYLEACESGSIFEGILPNDLNIYATTASNAVESSWGTYCPGMVPAPPPEYLTCLGDLYSVSWMEDSETHNLRNESLQEQYETVKARTSNYNTYTSGSHVMCYGSLKMSGDKVFAYIGNDPANENFNERDEVDRLLSVNFPCKNKEVHKSYSTGITQRDADILYLWHKFKAAEEGSNSKFQAEDELFEALSDRKRIDQSVELIGENLFGKEEAQSVFGRRWSPLVDDWDCLKAMVQAFEDHCGLLTSYGLKHMRAFANICNAGVDVCKMERVCSDVCDVAATATSAAEHSSAALSVKTVPVNSLH